MSYDRRGNYPICGWTSDGTAWPMMCFLPHDHEGGHRLEEVERFPCRDCTALRAELAAARAKLIRQEEHHRAAREEQERTNRAVYDDVVAEAAAMREALTAAKGRIEDLETALESIAHGACRKEGQCDDPDCVRPCEMIAESAILGCPALAPAPGKEGT